MKPTKILAMLLALLMLVSSFAACGETADDPSVTTQSGDTTAAESEAATELTDDLPDDLFYDDDEITIISQYREGWTSGEIAVKELISEPVNDAVFERNKAVEERLGVQIISIEEPSDSAYDVVEKAATAVRANLDDYDVLASACYVATSESLNGTFANMRESVYIDFDKPWWSQGFNEVMEYNDAQFCGLSSALLSQYRFAFVTLFNKDLFTDANQPYLYEAVENGSWTLDKQISLVPLFHQDNGNGAQDEEGDIYGLVSCDYVSTDPYWSSCMVDIIKKNGDGEYEFVFDSGKLHGVAEKVLRLFYETEDGTYDYKVDGENLEQLKIRDMFARGDAAMATIRIMELESETMRGMEDEFGVVPMPKYDEEQKEYRTLLHDAFTVISILKTVDGERLDEVGAVLEAMASVSYKTVRPAYYETTLRTKIAQDPQSAEMFDIIIDNIYMDAGILYTIPLNTFHDKFRRIIGSKNNTVTSDYKTMESQTTRSLNTLCKRLEVALKGGRR